MRGNIWLAFGITALAGLSTGIGSTIAFFAKKTNTKFLSVSLGFSAGVMIYVSMAELYTSAQKSLQAVMGMKPGSAASAAAFFGGMLLTGIIDRLIPQKDNPHEFKKTEEDLQQSKGSSRLMRTGAFTALAIAVHNFPEGLATFIAALQEPSVALPIAAAVAIHNIPEGIAVSVPIYYATGDRKKAFLYSFASGLSEPAGAAAGWLILRPYMNDTLNGLLFAGTAGIMVFISLDELLPAAREYGEHHLAIYGLTAGMAVIAVSLLMFM